MEFWTVREPSLSLVLVAMRSSICFAAFLPRELKGLCRESRIEEECGWE